MVDSTRVAAKITNCKSERYGTRRALVAHDPVRKERSGVTERELLQDERIAQILVERERERLQQEQAMNLPA